MGTRGAKKIEGRTLYLDMDGVFADFDLALEQQFGCSPRECGGDAVLWEKVFSNPTFFLDLPIMKQAKESLREISLVYPKMTRFFLTACPYAQYGLVAGQKIQWIRKHLGQHHRVLPVAGGRNKMLFMHREGDILIDDFSRNIDAWSHAGGVGIIHKSWDDSMNRLTEIMES